ncbi:MAG TPA: hypothetical protein PLB58_04250 [Bacilli bacterium]|nr:hypothetical protein [Bacilli bacterium]
MTKEKQNKANGEEKLILVIFGAAAAALVVIIVLQLVKILSASMATTIFMFVMTAINLLCSVIIRKDNRKLANFFLYNTVLLLILSMLMVLSLL